MDNSQNYSLIDSDCIPQRDTEGEFSDWFQDAASEADWADISLRDIDSNTACSLAGSVRSMSLLDEIYEKNKIIEREWKEAEQKYQNLQVENQKLSIQLANERHRANRYQKKLQYIEDNHEIFTRLKQAYLNMKYNESTGRTMVEIKEKACQTWEGILCEACIETEEMKRKAELQKLCSFTGSEPEMITVKRTDLANLKQTMQTLKNMVDKREESWGFNQERENTYKKTISELQANIQVLNGIIVAKHDEIASLKLTESSPNVVQKENGFLKKIIVKLEKRHRDMQKLCKTEKYPPLLNEQEKNMVHQLIQKYASKLKRKATRSLSCDTGSSLAVGDVRTPRTPRSLMAAAEPGDRVAETVGSGEGIVFNIPLTRSRPRHHNAEHAEKPVSPNKRNIAEQIDLIDFSDNIESTSTQM